MQLGQTGRDTITGFQGVITARAEYLTGCHQLLLTSTSLDKDGKRREGEWFDEQRITVVGASVVVLNNTYSPGADERQAPTR